jgi:hypothetical protein
MGLGFHRSANGHVTGLDFMDNPLSVMKLIRLVIVIITLSLCFSGTWTTNNFLYTPGAGESGTIRKISFSDGMSKADARLAKEAWVGDPNYGSTVQAAVTAIGSTAAILHVPAGTWPITDNLTIPANLTLRAERGANLSIATGKTLTINCSLEAGMYQIFSCTGTGKVVFAAGAVDKVFAEWFGAVGDNVHDDGNALAQAIGSLTSGIVQLQGKTYYSTVSITPKGGTGFLGYGSKRSAVRYNGLGYWLDFPTPASGNLYDDFTLSELKVSLGSAATGALRHGRENAAYSNDNFSEHWNLNNLWVSGEWRSRVHRVMSNSNSPSKSEWLYSENFARCLVLDRCTADVWNNIRVIPSAFVSGSTGIEWLKGDEPPGSNQEYMFGLDCLLTGVNQIGVKIDCGNVNIFGVNFEKLSGSNAATAFLYLTQNATLINVTKAFYTVSAGSITNLIKADDAATLYQRGVFIDHQTNSTAYPVSFGTTGSKWAWQFVSPNEFMRTVLQPAVVAKRVGIIGGIGTTVLRTPGACANLAMPQSIATATPTTIIFNGKGWDNDGMIDLVAHPTRITIVTPGIYSISANVGFDPSTVGQRGVRVLLNGASCPAGMDVPAASNFGTYLSAGTIKELAAGDYLEVEVYQTTGGALNVNQARLAVQRLSSAD